jgi:hypothetical protein
LAAHHATVFSMTAQVDQPVRETNPRTAPQKKSRIGLLAGAGLVILSLLALATALALVRAFRR